MVTKYDKFNESLVSNVKTKLKKRLNREIDKLIVDFNNYLDDFKHQIDWNNVIGLVDTISKLSKKLKTDLNISNMEDEEERNEFYHIYDKITDTVYQKPYTNNSLNIIDILIIEMKKHMKFKYNIDLTFGNNPLSKLFSASDRLNGIRLKILEISDKETR